MAVNSSKCLGCSAYKYCDTVISSIKLCPYKNNNIKTSNKL